jgi:predicted TPR repeat methyltransferase
MTQDEAVSAAEAPQTLTLEQALSLAVEFHRDGRLEEAEGIYGKILEASPDHPDALHFLGVLSHQRGRGEEALELIGRALALCPDHADAHNNRGNILKEQGRLEEAAEAYRRVIELRPDHADAHNNLGIVLKVGGDLEAATAAYQKAIALDPHHADAHHNLGNVLRRQGRLREAAGYFRMAVVLNPHHPEAPKLLGLALYSMGSVEEARTVFAEWLERDPGNPVAVHLHAACSGGEVPERASDRYVEEVFDGLSASFDEHLAGLEYQAPQRVLAAIEAELPAPGADLDVLDAGCGTGLCGPLLRPYAGRLVGVDLSAGMLAKARGLGVYDELVKAELTGFLADATEPWDLIVSADTLCYFGVLGGVLRGAAGALRDGGRLVFTVEQARQGEGFVLNGHGRYSHSESYVRRELGRAGLTSCSVASQVLRTEAGSPVDGLVVTAVKPGRSARGP